MGATGDLAIVNRTTETAPKDYTVPGAQEVMALAVTAAIDGSGAAGSFLPCLQLLDPAGDVLWTARTASSFSAGQSVDVSWFPRAGGITSTQSAGVTPDWGQYLQGAVTVPAGSHLAGSWTYAAGTALLNLTDPTNPTFVSRGVYSVNAWVQSSDTWSFPSLGGARLSFGSPTAYASRSTFGADHNGLIQQALISHTAQVDAGATLGLEYENFDTASRGMFSNQILVQLIYSY